MGVYGMNFAQNPTNVVVSLDWFSLSIQTLHPYEDGEAFSLPDGWQCLEMGATATWTRRWYIMDADGNKLGTFLAVPRSPLIPACCAMLEVANPVLYSEDFEEIANAMLAMYPMVVSGVSRADLCGDFGMTEAQWQVFRGLQHGDFYVKGLRQGVDWWDAKHAEKRPRQLQWGGTESVFHWKLYDKYKELHPDKSDLSEKPYIEALWQAVGIEPKTAWRLEVSITACNRIVDDTGVVIPMFDWWRRRDYLYGRIYGDKFVIREHQGHADRRSDPIVNFLSIESNTAKFLQHRAARSEMHSDAERRIVCHMWREFTDAEVRRNKALIWAIRDFLCQMFQNEANIKAVSKRYNVTYEAIFSSIEEVSNASVNAP